MQQPSRQIDAPALQDLRQLAQRRCGAAVAWRARIVLGCFAGAGYRQISKRLGCSQATIARWRWVWPRAWRASKPGPQQQLLAVFLPQTVHHRPRALGMAQERWTLPALQNLCGRQTGQRPSLESIRRALKRLGYSGKRAQRTARLSSPKSSSSPDPD